MLRSGWCDMSTFGGPNLAYGQGSFARREFKKSLVQS